MRKNIIFFSALLLAVPGAVFAAGAGNAIGTAGAQFLELPVGARAIAMGTAGGAVSQDATAIFYNPAGLAGMKENDVTLMQAFYFQNISYQFAGIAGKLEGDENVCGLGIQHLSPGAIDEVDNTGTPTGSSFTPGDLAVTAGFGTQFGILDIGIAGKYINSKIDKSASAYAADAGLRLNISKDFALAGSISNMGTKLKFRDGADSLPTLGRLGAEIKFKDILFAADLLAPKGAKMYFAAGTEFCAYQAENLRFLLRAGYNSRNSAGNLGGMTGFSAGTGFDIKRFSVDYAFMPFGDLGNSHRISLSMKFGEPDDDDGGKNALLYFAPGSSAFVDAGKAELYRSPTKKSGVADELGRGEELEVSQQIGNWVKVTAPSGKEGWLPKAVLGKKQ